MPTRSRSLICQKLAHNGNFDVLQYIFMKFQWDKEVISSKTFEASVTAGHLEQAQWIWSIQKKLSQDDADQEEASVEHYCCYAALRNHLPMLQWLLEIGEVCCKDYFYVVLKHENRMEFFRWFFSANLVSTSSWDPHLATQAVSFIAEKQFLEWTLEKNLEWE